MTTTRRRRSRRTPRYHARKPLRVGPYFRWYSATVAPTARRGRRARLGWTSQGFKFGRITANLTHGTYTYDNPGAGSIRDLPIPEWILNALDSTPLTRWLLRQP